ncbi:MAG: DNA alkylation repair protein [Acidimicrobiales bacterium]|nr:DNA alkylation repair protein [Acidimicrobiales bacterium]
MTVLEFARDLDGLLSGAARIQTKEWWERYLKGEAAFRGVKMADTRRIVNELVVRHRLDTDDAAMMLEHAQACFGQAWSEDKLAGVLLLAEHGLSSLTIDHVDDLAAPLARGHLADWNTVDWYCVKTLALFLVAGDDVEGRCRSLARWVHAGPLWQRRAGAVAFVNHAATQPELFDGFTDMLLTIAEVNAGDPTRWSQTSVGWLLRELASRSPREVLAFTDAHPELSSEARDNALKHLRGRSGTRH